MLNHFLLVYIVFDGPNKHAKSEFSVNLEFWQAFFENYPIFSDFWKGILRAPNFKYQKVINATICHTSHYAGVVAQILRLMIKKTNLAWPILEIF